MIFYIFYLIYMYILKTQNIMKHTYNLEKKHELFQWN